MRLLGEIEAAKEVATQFRAIATVLVSVLALGLTAGTCKTSDPTDGCTVYYHSYHTGGPQRAALPYGTLAVDSWANSSKRWEATDLIGLGLHDNISSAKILAKNSAVSLYLFQHTNFDGHGRVYHCPKESTCWVDFVGWINDQTSSLICQREFINQHDGGSSEATIVDMNQVEPAVRAYAEDQFGQSIPYVSIDWITEAEYCDYMGFTCDDEEARYTDLIKIVLRFTASTPFPVRSRDVTVNIYVKPQLVNGSFSYQNKGYWYYVQGGWVDAATHEIASRVVSKLNAALPSIPGNLLNATADHASPNVLNNRSRLQMHVPSHTGFADWYSNPDWFNEQFTPTMVLNRTRLF